MGESYLSASTAKSGLSSTPKCEQGALWPQDSYRMVVNAKRSTESRGFHLDQCSVSLYC